MHLFSQFGNTFSKTFHFFSLPFADSTSHLTFVTHREGFPLWSCVVWICEKSHWAFHYSKRPCQQLKGHLSLTRSESTFCFKILFKFAALFFRVLSPARKDLNTIYPPVLQIIIGSTKDLCAH